MRVQLVSTCLLSLVLVGPSGASAEEPRFRDLVRKFVSDQQAGVTPGELEGVGPGVQKVLPLEYTVLLRTPEGETAVDPASHEFQVGDQIRVRIQPLTDLYVYIFHEGASGEKTCLLPMDKEEAPLAKHEEVLDLPTDGSVFEFAAPAGEEKLIVVATETPSADLSSLADLVFKKPTEELNREEQELRKELLESSQKTLKSLRRRQSQGFQYRGLFTEEAVDKVGVELQKGSRTRAILEEPPHGKTTSTFAMAVFLDNEPGEMFLTISLRSVNSK